MTDDVLDHSRRKFFHFGAAALFASLTTSHAMAQSVSNKLKIGVIGSGHIGGAIGGLWVKAGHPVLFSSRHPEELKGLGGRARPTRPEWYGVTGGRLRRYALFRRSVRRVAAARSRLRRRASTQIVLDACNAVLARDGVIADE